jgi:hypothetical protein
LNCGFFALRHFLKKETASYKNYMNHHPDFCCNYFDLTTTNCDVNSEK